MVSLMRMSCVSQIRLWTYFRQGTGRQRDCIGMSGHRRARANGWEITKDSEYSPTSWSTCNAGRNIGAQLGMQ